MRSDVTKILYPRSSSARRHVHKCLLF